MRVDYRAQFPEGVEALVMLEAALLLLFGLLGPTSNCWSTCSCRPRCCCCVSSWACRTR